MTSGPEAVVVSTSKITPARVRAVEKACSANGLGVRRMRIALE